MSKSTPISGPIFELLIRSHGRGHVITYCDGALAGNHKIVAEIKRRLAKAEVTEPRFEDVCAVVQDLIEEPEPINIIRSEPADV